VDENSVTLVESNTETEGDTLPRFVHGFCRLGPLFQNMRSPRASDMGISNALAVTEDYMKAHAIVE
jgi:hypothetical protein